MTAFFRPQSIYMCMAHIFACTFSQVEQIRGYVARENEHRGVHLHCWGTNSRASLCTVGTLTRGWTYTLLHRHRRKNFLFQLWTPHKNSKGMLIETVTEVGHWLWFSVHSCSQTGRFSNFNRACNNVYTWRLGMSAWNLANLLIMFMATKAIDFVIFV